MGIARLGSIVADIRGKVGDEIYSRGPGGITVRSPGTWTQPDTDDQLAARAVITALSQAWSATLTNAQRSAWRQYARTHPRPNRWGIPNNTSGYNRFIRINAYEYRRTQALAYTTPPIAADLHPPVHTLTAYQNGTIEISGTLSPDVTGTYVLDAPYGGKPTWKHQTLDYWLWAFPSPVVWLLTDQPGTSTGAYWFRGVTRPGVYFPAGTATGNATATSTDDQAALRNTLPPDNYPSPPDALRLFAFAGKPTSQGVSYFNGPWRYAASVLNVPPWSADPWWFNTTFPAAAGQACRTYLVAQLQGDGALSSRATAIATAATTPPN